MNNSSFFIVGKHAVFEALKNTKRKVLRVFLTEESKKSIHRDSPKKNLLKDNREEVLQVNNQVKREQTEVLETVLGYLQSFHPEKYKIKNDSVLVESTKDLYALDQFENPIELASLLIQEDLVLMSPKNGKFFLTAASLVDL